jgi:Family of unknown function (DUF6788)
MNHRSQRSAQERHARSQLAQRITEQPFLRGCLVDRARSCGKPTCRCQKGQLHHSLYLAVNHRGQRALLYVPRALHATVRQWLANGRRIHQELQALHQQQLEHLLQQKQALLTRPAQHPSQRSDRTL